MYHWILYKPYFLLSWKWKWFYWKNNIVMWCQYVNKFTIIAWLLLIESPALNEAKQIDYRITVCRCVVLLDIWEIFSTLLPKKSNKKVNWNPTFESLEFWKELKLFDISKKLPRIVKCWCLYNGSMFYWGIKVSELIVAASVGNDLLVFVNPRWTVKAMEQS